MDDTHFWKIIDEAWQSDAGLLAFRDQVLGTITAPESKAGFEAANEGRDPSIPNEDLFLEAISKQLDLLAEPELAQFDRILERKLYDIDREEIHEFTDGSDDGFLYCRGFIVAMGQQYYDGVNACPSNALYDWECESITYISTHLYEKKFGALSSSDISRETGSNPAGW